MAQMTDISVITGRALLVYFHSAPNRGVEYCGERVCVCLSVIISSQLHVQSSPNFAGERGHGSAFRALKVTSQGASTGGGGGVCGL